MVEQNGSGEESQMRTFTMEGFSTPSFQQFGTLRSALRHNVGPAFECPIWFMSEHHDIGDDVGL